jgi:hypothetical protein
MIPASLTGPLAQVYSQNGRAYDLLCKAKPQLVAIVLSGRDGLRAIPNLISSAAYPTRTEFPTPPHQRLIPIELRLERAFQRKAEVFRLLDGQLCQLGAQLAQMKTGNLLV